MDDVKQLTELQKELFSKKLTNLRKDFPIKAVHILMEDGTEWRIGTFPKTKEEELPKAKPKHTRKRRRLAEGFRFGHCSEVMKPWAVMAMANPGEEIKLREDDLDGEPLSRASGVFSSMVGIYMGPKNAKTWRVNEDGEEVLYVMYTGPKRTEEELEYYRGGVIKESLYQEAMRKKASKASAESLSTSTRNSVELAKFPVPWGTQQQESKNGI